MQLRRRSAGFEHMGERSARAHREDHGAVALYRGGRRMALEDRGARALTHQHQRARDIPMGRIARGDEAQFNRRLDDRARRDLDQDPIARHGGVEGGHGVIGALIREKRMDKIIARARQRIAQGGELEACGQRARGQGADAVLNDHAQPAQGCGGHASGDRIGLAHEVAQVRIVPGLDAAMGQPALVEDIEGAGALATHGVAAGQARAALGEGVRKGRLGLGANGGGTRGHGRLTPHPRHNRGSRSSPTRAPVPCRRTSRCGRRRGYARCRARYNRADAGNG